MFMCMMLQLILPPTDSVGVDVSREYGGLEGLQIQLSKAVVTNCHVGDSGTRSRSNLQPLICGLGAGCVTWDCRAPMDFSAPPGTAYITKLLQSHADGDDRWVGVARETIAVHNDAGKPTSPLLTDGLCASRSQCLSLTSMNGSAKEPNSSIYFFFPPITRWCSISDVLFTGERGVSDFSVLKYC